MVVTTSVVPSPRLSKASFADAPSVRIFRALGGSGAGSGATGGAGSGSGRGAGGGGLAAAARTLRGARGHWRLRGRGRSWSVAGVRTRRTRPSGHRSAPPSSRQARHTLTRTDLDLVA